MIAILDYGSGNLRSAERAFATAGKEVVVTSDRTIAVEAEGLVVPGVGAFAACMNGLNGVDGAAIVRERLEKERPTLGICIGMQIMFSEGTEHAESGAHAGIGVWMEQFPNSKLRFCLTWVGTRWNPAPNQSCLRGLKESLSTLCTPMQQRRRLEKLRRGVLMAKDF